MGLSTFTITDEDLVSTIAEFQATIRGSRQEVGELQRLTISVLLEDDTMWLTLQSMTTLKYHVHSPIGGLPIIDIVRGMGEGELVIDGLGTTTALLVGLERATYLPEQRTMGSCSFLVTGLPI